MKNAFTGFILCQVLEDEGFAVERGVGGIETAFIGTFGSGKPVIAILGEFDALSGLSQKRGATFYEPVIPNGNGHGCGHNLLGTAPLAAVVALKQYMEEHNMEGTIRYYGCPGEEGGSGKTYMARAGLFDDADAALTWHPESFSGIFSLTTLANYQVYYKFKGVASHAANSPHLGRSALDAVELMNVGANYLREHILPDARLHYSVINAGGISPNVVQREAEVLYL
ncbi:amidohydrolase [Scopulibacillus darangshiensis]|uniref:Amidohydrolase n=1 Tax=Scopulibacillus darangshiensis TaxID=442528 RepID=A0A4V2SN40_9BACL|nr:amidohydrolase [Scopulibacillus darangshiensis]